MQVTDLGSTNGTYVDDEELPTNRPVDVPLGSRIVFGELFKILILPAELPYAL